jgi:hypothetical protein
MLLFDREPRLYRRLTTELVLPDPIPLLKSTPEALASRSRSGGRSFRRLSVNPSPAGRVSMREPGAVRVLQHISADRADHARGQAHGG